MLFQLPNMRNRNFTVFQPYEILGVDADTSIDDIRRSYRKLSQKYHPDKNPGDKKAEEQFVLVAKAYAALTDPVMKRNMELYGNPEGNTKFSMSYGLPSFLIRKQYEQLILFGYLIQCQILPCCGFFYWFNNIKSVYDDSGLKFTTLRKISSNLNTLNIRTMHQRIITCDEFDNFINIKPRIQFINKILPSIQNKMKNIQCSDRWCTMYACILYICYIQRISLDNELDIIKDDQKYVIDKVQTILDWQLLITFHCNRYDLFIKILHYTQYIIQAMDDESQQIKQIPYISQEYYTKLISSNILTLFDIYKTSSTKLLNILKCKDDDINILRTNTSLLPFIKIEAYIYIQGEKQYYTNEVLTCMVKIHRCTNDEIKEAIDERQMIDNLSKKAKERYINTKQNEISLKYQNIINDKVQEYQQDTVPYRRRRNMSINERKKYEEILDDHIEKRIWQKDFQTSKQIPTSDTNICPYVVSSLLPFCRKERWYLQVLLVTNDTCVILQKKLLSSLPIDYEVYLTFDSPPRESTYNYEIRQIPDCYVGMTASQVLTLQFCKRPTKVRNNVTTSSNNNNNIKHEIAEEKDNEINKKQLINDGTVINDANGLIGVEESQEDYSHDEDFFETKDINGVSKWYYLGGESLTEAIINFICIGVIIVLQCSWQNKYHYQNQIFYPPFSKVQSIYRNYENLFMLYVYSYIAPIHMFLLNLQQRFQGKNIDVPDNIREHRILYAQRRRRSFY